MICWHALSQHIVNNPGALAGRRTRKLAGRQTVHETPRFKHAPKPLAAAGVRQRHGNCTTAKPNSSTHHCGQGVLYRLCTHHSTQTGSPHDGGSNNLYNRPGTQPQPHTPHKIRELACSCPLLRSECCGGSSCTRQQRTQRRSRKPSRAVGCTGCIWSTAAHSAASHAQPVLAHMRGQQLPEGHPSLACVSVQCPMPMLLPTAALSGGGTHLGSLLSHLLCHRTQTWGELEFSYESQAGQNSTAPANPLCAAAAGAKLSEQQSACCWIGRRHPYTRVASSQTQSAS